MRRRKRLWFIHLQTSVSSHADTSYAAQSSRPCEQHTRRRVTQPPPALCSGTGAIARSPEGKEVSEGNHRFPSEAFTARPALRNKPLVGLLPQESRYVQHFDAGLAHRFHRRVAVAP